MLKLILSDEAKSDIRNIRDYTLKQWGNEHTRIYIAKLRLKIDFLREMPQIGVDRAGEMQRPVYSVFVGSHAIYYIFDETTLTVLSVLHQSMMPEIHMIPLLSRDE